MNYYFAFSWKGLIVFLLPMIPNLFYFLIPASNSNGSENNSNIHLILDVIEHGNQAIFIFLLIFVIRKQAVKMLCPYTTGMAIMLAFYYVLWIFCFTGKANFYILLAMAILPVVYFVLAEMWLHNYLAIIPTALFGVIHIIITYMDFQIKHLTIK